GLKILWWQHRTGSIPVAGTAYEKLSPVNLGLSFFLIAPSGVRFYFPVFIFYFPPANAPCMT
ncbi:MAG: hypothetical protein NC304_14670, partial [Robinsoniella sp.]|nr:hypothetical protein [Robinsoniella sp.]